jgi:hypothetical protein
MPDPDKHSASEALLARIDQRLAELGKSRWSLSMAVTNGASHGVIRDIARRKSMPGGERLRAIAEELETTTDWLLGKVDNPTQPVSEVSFRDPPTPWRGPPDTRIPVLGSAYCDDLLVHVEDANGADVHIERVQLETDHVVRMVERPPALWNSPDAYGIYYHGSSMEPRFFQGDIGIADPRRPPSPGDFVVVQITEPYGDEVITVIVKQLERIAGKYYYLKQFEPKLTFRLERNRVKRIHRILTLNEILSA